jgi:hypothetical protein
MKRILIGLSGAVALGVLTAAVPALSQGTKPTPTATARPAGSTWQYGYLVQPRVGGKVVTSFVAASRERADGESLEELLRSYGVTPTAHPVTYDVVLDALGADGWELVQVQGTDMSEATFYFKRAANQ